MVFGISANSYKSFRTILIIDIWNNTQLLRKRVTYFKKSYFSFQENMEVGPLRKNLLGSFLENRMVMGYYICHLLVLS